MADCDLINVIFVYVILHGQYTSDPQFFFFFTDSEPPIKLLLGGLIRGAPTPPNPPYGGAEVFFLGLLLLDHSDHPRVKYI